MLKDGLISNNPKHSALKYSKGFNFAEVLILIVIFGIITTAAFFLFQTNKKNTENKEIAEKLKNTYNILSRATSELIYQYGTPKASAGGWAVSSEKIMKMYKNKLFVTYECPDSTGCSKSTMYKSLSGDSYEYYNQNSKYKRSYIILHNGAKVFFIVNDSMKNCTYSKYGSKNQCATLLVDLNAEKAPNQIGIDSFYFALKENGLFPRGSDEKGFCNDSSKPNSSVGFGCASKVLLEGAINY